MKKYLLLLTFCALNFFQILGQNCSRQLSPNHALSGQTLTTTISGTQFFNGYGSAPCNPSDVYLYHSSTATTIHASSLNIQNSGTSVLWNIPSNAPNGLYDLNLKLYNYTPFGSCSSIPWDCGQWQYFNIGLKTISGSVFYDSNQDSVFNNNDVNLSNRKVLLLPENKITLTNDSGGFLFFADTGNHTIIVLNDTSFYSVNSDTINVNVSASNIDSVDFAIYPTFFNYNSSVYLDGPPRCNTIRTYYLGYRSTSILPVNLVIKFIHSLNTQFISSDVTPDSIVGDTVYFSALNFNYGLGHIHLNISIPGQGSSISFNEIVNTYDLAGNFVATTANKLIQTVSCSYDPNDKKVNPPGEQAQHYTLFGNPLFYTIRFQNTGNDTAYDVHIIDTIDTKLDLSTLEIISSSHPLNIEIGSNRVINFSFNNIMLPDSFVDEPASNGYVSYTIRTLDSLPEMTLIKNRAYIFFDQNSPVKTNQTFNTMVSLKPVGIDNLIGPDEVLFYPNPFNESITLTNLNNNKSPYQLSIIDIQGRELYNNIINTNNYIIDLHNLSSGIYFCKLLNIKTNTLSFSRLVKQ